MDGMEEFGLFFWGLFVFLLCIMLPVAFWRCTQPDGNEDALKAGIRHAKLCFLKDPKNGHKPYEFFKTNMHNKVVMGAGVNLYYNAVTFYIIFFAIATLFTSLAYWVSGFASVHLRAETCLLTSEGDEYTTTLTLHEYQWQMCWSLGLLWVVLMVVSLRHAQRQHLAFRLLDAKTNSMADYGIAITGLPGDVTETELLEYLEPCAPTGSLIGVSIAYDYLAHKDLVDSLLDIHVQHEDVKLGLLEDDDLMYNEAADTQDREYVKKVLSTLQCSGTAWVIFDTEMDLHDFRDVFDDSRVPFRGKFDLNCFMPPAEPQTFFWHHFTRAAHEKPYEWYRKATCEVCKLAVQMVFYSSLVYVPGMYYMKTYTESTGMLSDDAITSCLGFLVAIVNGILYVPVWYSSLRVEFRWKVQADVYNLICTLVIIITQTAWSFGITLYTVAATEARIDPDMAMQGPGANEVDSKIRYANLRMFVGRKLWDMNVPGYMIMPYIIYPLTTYLLKWKTLLKYYVTIWLPPFVNIRDLRSDPELKPRMCERQMEPEPIYIQFDYANSIIVPMSGLSILFFETKRAHWVCAICALFHMYYYYMQKYCHLYHQKVVDFTSMTLDDCQNHFWGLPLSMFAAASMHWASILGYVPWYSGVTAFFASLVLYLLLLRMLYWLEPEKYDGGRERGLTYEDCRRLESGCDWFNTNPIYVLRRHCLHDGKSGVNAHGDEPIVYFTYAKEYQQGERWGNDDVLASSRLDPDEIDLNVSLLAVWQGGDEQLEDATELVSSRISKYYGEEESEEDEGRDF
jgi:hypothetical protein